MIVREWFGIVTILLIVVFFSLCHNVDRFPKARCEHIIKGGDLLFRRGHSFSSRVVLMADIKGSYTHIGLVVDVGDSLMVAHTEPDGDNSFLKIEPLEGFFSKDKSVKGAICRFKLDTLQLAKVNKRALELCRKKVMFDGEYNTESQAQLYCTEFVWDVFKVLGWDITNGRRCHFCVGNIDSDIILPSYIYENVDLEILITY